MSNTIPIVGRQGFEPGTREANPYAVGCPKCGSVIGEYCHGTHKDGIGYCPHSERRDAWRARYGAQTKFQAGEVPPELERRVEFEEPKSVMPEAEEDQTFATERQLERACEDGEITGAMPADL